MSTAPLGSRPGPATGHREAAADGREWVVDAGQVWAMGAGLVLLVVGALLGRPDAALLGVPAVLGSAWTLVSRPGGRVRVDARLAPSSDGLHALREAAPAPEGAGGSGVAGHGDVSRGDRLETVTAVQTLVAGGSLVARLDLHAPPGAGTVRVRAIVIVSCSSSAFTVWRNHSRTPSRENSPSPTIARTPRRAARRSIAIAPSSRR